MKNLIIQHPHLSLFSSLSYMEKYLNQKCINMQRPMYRLRQGLSASFNEASTRRS